MVKCAVCVPGVMAYLLRLERPALPEGVGTGALFLIFDAAQKKLITQLGRVDFIDVTVDQNWIHRLIKVISGAVHVCHNLAQFLL